MQIKKQLQALGADAVLLTFLPDIRWAVGFSGSNGVLIVRPEEAHFLSDGRYQVQARREVHGTTVHIPGYELYRYAAETGLFGGARRVLFQADHVTVAQLDDLKQQFPSITWVPARDLLVRHVASKDEEEVARLQAAQRITDQVFTHLLGFIRPGRSEQEVAAEIVHRHLLHGADRMSFDPIVASGPQGALPHARPSPKPIARGELVVIDMGCFLDGYASDMTRTVAVGEPGEEARRVYHLVLEAQEKAIEAARAGMSSKALDGVARQVIEAGGYGPHFSHGLGHGVGLQVHEWPRLSYHVDHVLPEGAAVTIEPGIYLPDRFGVRIEDVVVLREAGCDNLTRSPKNLIVL